MAVIRSIQNKLFIDGKFVDALAGRTIDVINPHNGSLITKVAAAGAEDVDIAVAAAAKAFPAWRDTSATERGDLLRKLADKLEQNFEEMCQLESLDTGHPIRDTRFLDVKRTIINFRYFSGLADKIDGREVPVDPGLLNIVKRVPVGVVGQIVPWNFPLMFCSWKLGPALAAGNTVVLKPSEIVPLSTLRLAEILAEVGFPPGVVNVVPGYGATAGQRLAEHPDVQKIAFTGSTETGRKIVQASTGNLKKLQLELGGKGANIIFADARMNDAVNGAAFAIFHNQGQACIAGSRIIIHESVIDQFLEKFSTLANSIRLGNPLDPNTQMGPLTSELHQKKVLDYCAIAREQGNEIITGGCAPEQNDLADGYYVKPTIVMANKTDQVFNEEVFGPFVSVTSFSTDEEAIELANSTEYALGGGLWTQNFERAHKVANKIQAGMVWINTYKRVYPGSPFGGMGASGYGRDLGIESIQGYTDAKAMVFNYGAGVHNFYAD